MDQSKLHFQERKNSEECQKPQPPLLLKKVSQYASNLYCSTPPICIAGLLMPLRFEEREILSVLLPFCIAVRLPFVLQYASNLYLSTFGKIVVVVVTRMFPKNAQEEGLGRISPDIPSIKNRSGPSNAQGKRNI